MRALLLGCFLAHATLMTSAIAGADDRAACLDAVSKGQTLRDEHKLVEARDQFRVCARSQCPSVVQSDCAGFLDAVERNLPSVVFTAKDGAGAEMTDVQVSADGQPLVTKLDGAAVAMNPGPHAFVFASGGVSSTKRVTILEGAKNQVVSATLAVPPPAPATATPTPASPPTPAARPETPPAAGGSKGSSTVPIAMLAVGGVGLATGVVFTVLAHGKRADGDNLCPGGACPDADASQINGLNGDATTFGQIAVTSYVVGGVALAAGIVLLVTHSHHAARTDAAGLVVVPTVGLGSAGIAGVF